MYGNELLIRYRSNSQVPSIKKTKVSDEFVEVLMYLFDTGEINYEKLRELSLHENELFKNLIMKSGLFDLLRYNYKKTRENIDDILEEYEILRGQLEAGNSNPELMTQSKKVLKKLLHYGKISEKEYREITDEI